MSIRSILVTISKIISIIVLIFYLDNYVIISRIQQLAFINGYFAVAVFIMLWVLSIAGLLAASFCPNIYVRCFLTVIVFLSSLTEASYSNISGHSLLYDNLYILLENFNFAEEALSTYTSEILRSFCFASLSFIFLIPPPNIFKSVLSRLLSYCMVLTPFCLIFSLALLRGGYGMGGLPAQYRLPVLTFFIAVENIMYSSDEVETVEYETRKDNLSMNVVLIVDESLRADYLDINQENMRITPYLYNQKDKIINFGYASSGSNCSAESNVILRFGPNITQFEKTFQTNPSIWQYAKKAGYKTVMIEGQAKEGIFTYRMTKKEVSYIDDFRYSKGRNVLEKDNHIAVMIKRIIFSANQPVFIMAVKNGLHFPYDSKVPEKYKKYISTSKSYDLGTKQDFVNSYKNAVSYLIDSFFSTLMENIEYKDTIIFYTSDHGQNLLDNGYKITHCSTSNISPYEGLVPLLIISDNVKYKERFKTAALKNIDKSSHYNIVPTILTIFGYEKSDIKKRHGKTLFDDIHEGRKFISGITRRKKLGIGSKNKTQWNKLPDDFVSVASDKSKESP